ncbi:MAG: alanine--glyoxylate aminotransferase family protein [Pirellulaceae bacterium]
MSNSFPELVPPLRTLMGPGPSDIHPRVLQAMGKATVGHLDPFYLELMDRIRRQLQGVFRTTNEMTFSISATGSSGMETCVVNLVEPGDTVVVCTAGYFGNRLTQVAERCGAEVIRVEREWGTVFTPADLQDALAKKPKVVAIVQAETSTGANQPLEEISIAVHDAGALLLVDAVTALGAIPVEVDAWQVDAIYSCSQKGLSCPPGLSPVSFSPQAVETVLARKTPVQSFYFDISLLAKYWGTERVYHHTAPINMNYGLYEGLRLLEEEGLENVFSRHVRNHQALKAGLSALGVQYAAQEGYQLPQLNAVLVPAGIDEAAVRKQLLERFSIEIGSGLGAFKGKVWRIGLMGYGSRQANVLYFLGALEQLLAEAGHRFTAGSSVAAANGVYAG